jgi:hypothetical protein
MEAGQQRLPATPRKRMQLPTQTAQPTLALLPQHRDQCRNKCSNMQLQVRSLLALLAHKYMY